MSGPTDLLKKIFDNHAEFDALYDKDDEDKIFDIEDINFLTDSEIALPFISESSADIYIVGTDTIKDYLDDYILNTVTSPTISSFKGNPTGTYRLLYQNYLGRPDISLQKKREWIVKRLDTLQNIPPDYDMTAGNFYNINALHELGKTFSSDKISEEDVDAVKTELSRLIEIATIKSAVERVEQRESKKSIAKDLEVITKPWPNLEPVPKDASQVYSPYIHILARKRILIYLERFGLLDRQTAPAKLIDRITVDSHGSVQIDQTNYPGIGREAIPEKIRDAIGKITSPKKEKEDKKNSFQGEWDIFSALHEKTPNYLTALTAVDTLFSKELSKTDPWPVTDEDFNKNPESYLKWAALNLVMTYLEKSGEQKLPDLDKEHLKFLIEKTRHIKKDKDPGLYKSYEDFCRKLILLTGLIQLGQSTKTNDQIEAIHLISSRLAKLYGNDDPQYKEDAHELTYFNLAPFLEEFNNTSLDENWADKLTAQSSRLLQVSGFRRIDQSLTSLQDKQDLLLAEYQKTNGQLERLAELSEVESNTALKEAGHFSITSLAAKITFSRLIDQKLSRITSLNDSINSLTQNTPQHRKVVIVFAEKIVEQAVKIIEGSNKEQINSVSDLKKVLDDTLDTLKRETAEKNGAEKKAREIWTALEKVMNDPDVPSAFADSLKIAEFAVDCYCFYLEFDGDDKNGLITMVADLSKACAAYAKKISETLTEDNGNIRDPHAFLLAWNKNKGTLKELEKEIVTLLDKIKEKLEEMELAIPQPPENTSDESLSDFANGLKKILGEIKASVTYAQKIMEAVSIGKIDEQIVNRIERKLTEHGNVSLLLGLPLEGTPQTLGRLGYEVVSLEAKSKKYFPAGSAVIDGAVLFSFDEDFISGAELGGAVLFCDPANKYQWIFPNLYGGVNFDSSEATFPDYLYARVGAGVHLTRVPLSVTASLQHYFPIPDGEKAVTLEARVGR